MVDWDFMDRWHNTLPPNRPDTRNMDILRVAAAAVSRRKPKRVAVLGCTPEYREVLRSGSDEIYVFDRSGAFKLLSDSIVGCVVEERFIEGDWLETLPAHAGAFDLICSHFTHGNLEFESRQRLFRAIARALAPEGVFFDTVFDLQRTFSLDDLRARFATAPVNLATANELNSCALFQGEYIHHKGVVDTTAAYEWLRPLRSDQHLASIIEYTKRITPEGLIWYYSPGRGPETLGCFDVFTEAARVWDSEPSPFARNSYVTILRPRAS